MPNLSVIIPSYNHAHYIGESIQSVLGQTISDIELIIVDDGSTDDTLSILNSSKDARLKIVSQENKGAHHAINRGLNEASGDYLAILNSDDVYHPQRFEKLLPILMKQENIGLVSSYIQIIDQNSKPLSVKHGYHDLSPWPLQNEAKSFRSGNNLKNALLAENYLATTSNYLFSRNWYKKVGEFRPLRYTHDWDFALRMAQIADIAMVSEPLLNYRVHNNNTIRENQGAMIFEICWCLAVHLPQHINSNWFSVAKRTEQLLHSIYTFGVEQVLVVMLLSRLHENLELALQLLDPNNPTRLKYIEYIEQSLRNQTPMVKDSLEPTINQNSPSNFISRLVQNIMGRL